MRLRIKRRKRLMEHNEAVQYLKGYQCMCQFGSGPSYCTDPNCPFYNAVNALKLIPTEDDKESSKCQ